MLRVQGLPRIPRMLTATELGRRRLRREGRLSLLQGKKTPLQSRREPNKDHWKEVDGGGLRGEGCVCVIIRCLESAAAAAAAAAVAAAAAAAAPAPA
jgi:hypothetical protein